MDFSFWMGLLAVAVIINVSPGPDIVFILTKTARFGKKAGYFTVLGLAVGALFHTALVAWGISAIMETSQVAFNVVKIFGAGYLFYLAWHAFRSGALRVPDGGHEPTERPRKSFVDGVIVDVTNPKVALFFASLLPQFSVPDGPPQSLQFLLYGLVIIAVGMVIESCLVHFSDKAVALLKGNPKVSRWLDRVFGSVLGLLGVRLLFENQKGS